MKTMRKKHQTNGRVRMPKTFAESVEFLLAIGAILKALVCVCKLFHLSLIPLKLAKRHIN